MIVRGESAADALVLQRHAELVRKRMREVCRVYAGPYGVLRLLGRRFVFWISRGRDIRARWARSPIRDRSLFLKL